MQLLTRSSSFSEGEKSRLRGDYTSAVQQLTQALPFVSGSDEEGAVKLRIAIAKALSGDKSAIPLYKEIAANAEYSSTVRAYAVQNLVVFLMSNGGKKEFVQETVKDEPYKSLYDPEDLMVTYRHMSEYASSIYPVADSELLIAAMHASSLIKLKKAKNRDTAKIAHARATVDQKLASAAKDLERIRSQDKNYQDTIPYVLLQRANVFARLETAKEKPKTNPEQAYKEALDAYAMYIQVPGADAFARYHYADYLARKYGVKAQAQIHSLTAPFYTDVAYTNNFIHSYLQNVKTSSKGLKKSAIKIALADAAFKDHLITLGWEDSDFK